MESKTVRVPGIMCDGCVNAIESELSDIPGVAEVKAELESKLVRVRWASPATWQQVVDTLNEIEYPPELEQV